MPGVTPNAGIPYPVDGDTLRSAVSTTPKAAAEAIDAAFGLAGIGAAVPKRASIVVSANSNGDAYYAFPVPFAAGVFPIVVACVGDLGPGFVVVNGVTNTSVAFRVFTPGGAPFAGFVRINYIAIPS